MFDIIVELVRSKNVSNFDCHFFAISYKKSKINEKLIKYQFFIFICSNLLFLIKIK